MATVTEPPTGKNKKSRRKSSPRDQGKERLHGCIVIAVLTYSFIAGLWLSLMIASKKVDIEDIKGVWGIFTPIITLVLGYFLGMKKERP